MTVDIKKIKAGFRFPAPITPETPEQDEFFTTFYNVRGKLFAICETIREEAYKQAYTNFLELPRNKKLLDEGKATLEELEKKADEEGKKVRQHALPATPLGVAVMLKKYIRFVRIKPEAQGQKAPLYFYNPSEGIWLEDNELLKDLISVIFPTATEKQANDILYKIARQSPLKTIQREYTAIGYELYNANTGHFEEFGHDVIATRKIKTGYNPYAIEPDIDGWKPTEWLKELFDHDEELYNLAIQVIRACVTGKSLQKIFWLQGEGGTGKGTFQQLLINLIGLKNIASMKITELNKSPFTTSILLGKSVVIGDDVQKDAIIKDTSIMFSLATGDILTIEEKWGNPYSIRLNMTIIQSSNGFPRMNGDRSAIDRRFRLLPFTRAFTSKPNKAIKTDYINRQDVLEFFLKLALETPTADINPRKSVEILDEYQKEINPVLDFTSKFFTEDLTSEFIPNSFVYHVWKGFLEYYGIKLVKSERGLHREIKNNLPEGFSAGQKTIPAGQQLSSGFYPKDDLPPFANGTYTNGRGAPERRKKPKNERGYFNHRAKKKKR